MCLLKEVIYVMHPVIFLIITIGIQKCSSAYYSVSTKPVGLLSPKSVRISEVPAVTLLVEVPMSSVQYAKPMDVKAGAKFYLETPMEHYAYLSAGRSQLHRVKVVYLMQSMYRANHMCFFLHFWSMKDPTVPWTVPHQRITPPPWFGKRIPK